MAKEAIERVSGLEKENFHKLYTELNGFNGFYNENHPEYAEGETFFSFLEDGAKALVSENLSLAQAIKESY